MLQTLEQAIYLIGVIILLKTTYAFGNWVKDTFFVNKDSLLKYQTDSKNAYAVVTGPTGGIGQAFCDELASKGFNLILVGRNQTKLDKLKEGVSRRYPAIRIQTVISDAKDTTPENFSRVAEAVAAAGTVSILVNNVGAMNKLYGTLEETSSEELESIIRINCTYTTLLTKSILPILKKNRSSRSLILNVSSASSYGPGPLMSVYASSKWFISGLSEAIRLELRGSNVDVTCVCPGFVKSDMCQLPDAADPVVVAQQTFGKVHLKNFSPYWQHAATFGLLAQLPGWLKDRLLLTVVNQAGKVHNASVLERRKHN